MFTFRLRLLNRHATVKQSRARIRMHHRLQSHVMLAHRLPLDLHRAQRLPSQAAHTSMLTMLVHGSTRCFLGCSTTRPSRFLPSPRAHMHLLCMHHTTRRASLSMTCMGHLLIWGRQHATLLTRRSHLIKKFFSMYFIESVSGICVTYVIVER